MTTPEELDAQIRNAEALLAMNASGSTVPRIPHAAVEIIHGLTSAITVLRARVAELEAERDDARAMLAKANNEFGSETWSWPDLWRRIAQLKDLSNERWRRATAAEAELARRGQGVTGDGWRDCPVGEDGYPMKFGDIPRDQQFAIFTAWLDGRPIEQWINQIIGWRPCVSWPLFKKDAYRIAPPASEGA